MSGDELIVAARLSAQRALLGEVGPAMRGALLSVNGTQIDLRCYFDGPIEPADIESVSCAETEMMADFEPKQSVSAKCIRVDAPLRISDDGVWIYLRRERGP